MISDSPRGTVIEISVRPKAGKCRVEETSGGRLRVSVTAPPEDGKATKQALATVAAALGVPSSAVELLVGKTTRHKTLLVTGLNAAQCASRLAAATGERP